MREWRARGRIILGADDPVPKVMGIVNATPDSFSDAHLAISADAPIDHARKLVIEGADLLDLGGESTQPGAQPVSLEEELRRVLPVVRQLASEVSLPLSIDTSKAEVARQALKLGASIINDVTALRGDLAMAEVIADAQAGVVLMHMQGVPKTMQDDPRYDDVVAEVYDFLAARIEWCASRGIPRERIAIDPGIGFGKTFEHNLQLLRNLDRFVNLECAVLVGISRKGFLKPITGGSRSERMVGSVISSLAACTLGAGVVRVHDVQPMADALKVWTALRDWRASS
jgi:dihydropteroate synthase